MNRDSLYTKVVVAFAVIACTAFGEAAVREGPGSVTTVFVIGGIHQTHERAKHYTYERMGEIYRELSPDLLCVEVLQKNLDNGSMRGMPYDFAKYMVPSAKRDGIPIYGVDWWDDDDGEKWKRLQSKAGTDASLTPEIKLVGGIYKLLNDYFVERDFAEINSPEISALWGAKNNLKYKILDEHEEYRFIAAFERKRNEEMLANVLKVVTENPGKRILVAVGIYHKYYLEAGLAEQNVTVLDVNDVQQRWAAAQRRAQDK